LAECDNQRFDEESNEERDKIPTPLETILTPQWYVVWPEVTFGPADYQECGIPDKPYNGKEENNGQEDGEPGVLEGPLKKGKGNDREGNNECLISKSDEFCCKAVMKMTHQTYQTK